MQKINCTLYKTCSFTCLYMQLRWQGHYQVHKCTVLSVTFIPNTKWLKYRRVVWVSISLVVPSLISSLGKNLVFFAKFLLSINKFGLIQVKTVHWLDCWPVRVTLGFARLIAYQSCNQTEHPSGSRSDQFNQPVWSGF